MATNNSVNKQMPTGNVVGDTDAQSLTHKNLTDATNTFPTLNQNTTGTASNVTGVVAVANGGTGATSLAAASIVTGPASSTDSYIAQFNGTTGKVVKEASLTYDSATGTLSAVGGDLSLHADTASVASLNGTEVDLNAGTGGIKLSTAASSVTVNSDVVTTNTATQTLSGKTLTKPVIGTGVISPGEAAGEMVYTSASNTMTLSDGTTTHQMTTNDGTQTLTGKSMSGSSNTFTNIPESAVTNLTTDLAAKATNSAVVHLAGTETITGNKTISDKTLTMLSLAAPAPTVTVFGTAGTTPYTYYLVVNDANGNKSDPGPGHSTTSGNATLNATNYNAITWAAVPGAVSYDVLAGDTAHSIATGVTGTSLNDTGLTRLAYATPVNGTATLYLDTITGNNVASALTIQAGSNQSLNLVSNSSNTPLTIRGATTGFVSYGVEVHGGDVTGASSDGAGPVSIYGGYATGGGNNWGGNVLLKGGNATSGSTNSSGGGVYLQGGTATGIGTKGDVIAGNPGRFGINPDGSAYNAYLVPSITANRTYTFPDATDTMVGRATTDTLTNKDLTSGTNTFPTFNQNTTGTAANVTGTVAVVNGGTGDTTLTSGNVLVGAGTSPVTATKAAPSGNFVGDTDTQTLTHKTITDTTNSVSSKVLTNPYKFRAYRNTDQSSLTMNAFNKVQLTGKTFDTSSNFDNTTNYRFTAPIAGFYQFNGRVYTANGTSIMSALYVNGTAYSRGDWIANSGSFIASTVSDFIQLNANDYVELWGFINGTSATFTSGGTTAELYLSGFLVSAL